MADKELQTILNSGEINSIYIGAATSPKKVQIKEDMTAANSSFDDTDLGITAVSVQAALAILGEVGMSVMTGTSIAPQTIGTSPTKLNTFDALALEVGVGTEASFVDDKVTITLSGLFKMRFEAFVSYASHIDIEWQIYKNGSPFGVPLTLSGQGTTVFHLCRMANAEFAADDYLELYATASASTDLTIVQSAGSMEKTIF